MIQDILNQIRVSNLFQLKSPLIYAHANLDILNRTSVEHNVAVSRLRCDTFEIHVVCLLQPREDVLMSSIILKHCNNLDMQDITMMNGPSCLILYL